jgi:hypothetical protein
MAFKFIPFGIPFSSSFAVTASHALTFKNLPVTAAYAEYAINTSGSTGDPYKTISGSNVVIYKYQ